MVIEGGAERRGGYENPLDPLYMTSCEEKKNKNPSAKARVGVIGRLLRLSWRKNGLLVGVDTGERGDLRFDSPLCQGWQK